MTEDNVSTAGSIVEDSPVDETPEQLGEREEEEKEEEEEEDEEEEVTEAGMEGKGGTKCLCFVYLL